MSLKGLKPITLTVTYLFFSSFTVGKAQDISLHVKEAKLKEVLTEIKKQSAYRFFLNDELVADFAPITLDVKNASVDQILDQLFDGSNLAYTKKGNTIVIEAKKTAALPLSQQTTVSGVVSDSISFVPGVTIAVKNNPDIKVVTNQQGRFNIAVPRDATLIFRHVSYLTKEIILAEQADLSNLSIRLNTIDSQLDEVVVVGYGTVKRAEMTGSVALVNAKQITQVNAVSNVAQALQGQAPGVQVNQASGQPGEGMKISIRGTNSLGASNAPLYVVDGLPLDGLSAQLNPEDIETISVLKDASSTAIYGSRGANGVIMITTKKGVSGKPNVAYNNYFGSQRLRKKMDLLNAAEFATLQNEVARNEGNALPWDDEAIRNLGNGTDWQDLVYRSALVHNHDLSFQGGSERTTYYSSFGYFSQDGIIRNSGFQRLSFRINLEQKLTDKIRFSTNASIQNSRYNQAQYQGAESGGGIPWTTMVMPPTQGVYNPDGSYTKFTGVPWGETNPVGISENWHNVSNNLRLIGNAVLSYEIIKGLNLKLSAGIDHSNDKGDSYYPSNISLGQRTDADGIPIFGVASKSYGSSISFINENTLDYKVALGEHQINALAGFTYQNSKSDGLNSGNGIGFLSDIYQNNNLSSAITKALPSTSYLDNRLISYLGRINYNYGGKYFATLTGRYDGSSRFGADNKFAFFPSAAAAWSISQEDFLKDNPALSNLKLRLSYGASGNQAISSYQTLANLSSTDVTFDNQLYSSFILSALSNPNLKWETTKQFDVGVDLGLFGDKLQFVADYYHKRTTDLLLNVTLPGSGGFGSVLQNVGVVQNKGFEFQVSAQPNIGDNIKWSTSFNITSNRTKVLDLGVDAHDNPVVYKEIGTGGNWFPTLVGQSMMQFYGYTVEGVYQTDEEAIMNGEPTKKAGDYRFKNWDGQGVVNDQDDRTVLSRLEPKFTFGFNNSFTYRSFDLSFLIVGSYGNDIVNEFRKYNISLNGDWVPSKEAFEQRWQGPGTSQTIDRPSVNSGSSIRDYANSLWLENGSYLRLRDITLGYTFSPSLLKNVHLSSIRFYISLQNYLTLTKYSGYDPEVSWAATSINGWDRGNYPATKSITAGLKVNF